MKKIISTSIIYFLVFNFCFAQSNKVWHGKKCAVVLTYDDAIPQQLDNAIPALDSFKLKATFYITAYFAKDRLNDWKKVATKGFELGNHTLFHPCNGGVGREWVVGEQDMSKYSIKRLEDEIRMTNVFLESLDGKKKKTFAYTCGDMKLGDSSFMNGMKNDFVAARAVRSQMHKLNEVNLYDVDCYAVNGETGEQLIELVKKAEQNNSLLVFLFHGVGGGHSLNVSLDAHRKLLQYLHQNENNIWIAPMLDVAEYIKSIQSPVTYTQPILSGFYPDPSICKAGDDYYLINSTFVYYPGIPIFHSKDLKNWKQIGNAINRSEQVNFEGAGTSRGLYAPAISYHNGTFYIVCTLVDKGGNFVITAKNPAGPWSNPVWLKEVNGIDPSLFFDKGKAYIVYNSNPPENKSLWNGHRTIRMQTFDEKNLKTLDDEKIIVNGGVDTAKHPVWIEGPHIFKKDDYYYLICAEGGTGYNHSEVVFRTKNLNEPFVPFNNNPILSQRQFSADRKNGITTTGHADFVQTNDGKWFSVFLGCQPYESDYYNTGRETFMLPVTWKDGWPMILEKNQSLEYKSSIINNFSGNYLFKDEFDETTLNNRYVFLRVPNIKWHSLSEKKGMLSINVLSQTCAQLTNSAFIGFRQAHNNFDASTNLQFKSNNENEKAGLLVFQNEHHYYFLCQSVKNNQTVVQLYQSTPNDSLLLLAEKSINTTQRLQLKISGNNANYNFSYATEKDKWLLLKDNVDGKFLSTKTAGGFVGTMIAMYATSNGKPSNNKAYFDSFQYQGKNETL